MFDYLEQIIQAEHNPMIRGSRGPKDMKKHRGRQSQVTNEAQMRNSIVQNQNITNMSRNNS